ncbi:uncharacterized protein LOC106469376 [Limulus polyphemus]|uniref:Uncharacterized protein LOC106469376 n=1 Tax=Limulus polyphemus TaxID=6850 RepID=A0ABM1BN37_LIMPO|nr:uncharacterized protein LOC106469376 [Limulus polyphemus]
MAYPNKHLSTHVYFHMDRSSQSKSEGDFNTSGPPFEAERSRSNKEKPWNKENTPLRSVRPNQLKNSRSTDIVEGYCASQRITNSQSSDTPGENRAKLRFTEPSTTRKMGREHSRLDFDDFDAFCHTPTMLSPEEKSKHKHWYCGFSIDKYEQQYQDYLQPLSHQSLQVQETTLEEKPLDRRQTKSAQNRTRRLMDVSIKPKRPSSTTSGSSEATETSKQQDCFIIPAHFMRRFVPFGKEGQISSMPSQALSMIEVQDPKICIIIDFGEKAAFTSQAHFSRASKLDTPSRDWISTQLEIQRKKFHLVRKSQAATEGMLLINVERCSQFPFMTYLVLNKNHSDPKRLTDQLEDSFSTSENQEQLQHLAVYEEVATIARPPLDMLPKTPTTNKTGYIISAFRVLPGEDREKLERSWLTWTGARHLYKNLPENLGFRRITFHKKRIPDRGITYVLLCECAELMNYVTEACVYVDQLRARCCGYIAFFRVVEMF